LISKRDRERRDGKTVFEKNEKRNNNNQEEKSKFQSKTQSKILVTTNLSIQSSKLI